MPATTLCGHIRVADTTLHLPGHFVNSLLDLRRGFCPGKECNELLLHTRKLCDLVQYSRRKRLRECGQKENRNIPPPISIRNVKSRFPINCTRLAIFAALEVPKVCPRGRQSTWHCTIFRALEAPKVYSHGRQSTLHCTIFRALEAPKRT